MMKLMPLDGMLKKNQKQNKQQQVIKEEKMKKLFLSLVMLTGAMSSFAYDKATEGTEYYGSGIRAFGLADGTVAISAYYLSENQTDVTFPATIQIWTTEEPYEIAAEYEVSQIGYQSWNFWFDNSGADGLAIITSMTVPEGVTTINGSFWGATALKTLTLPSTLTGINVGWAFGGATALTSIVCNAATPPTLASGDMFPWAIIGDKTCTVAVPSGAANNYNQTPWTYWTGFYEAELISEVTGIEDVQSSKVQVFKDSEIFDLQGRRVAQPMKGQLYIINGKKSIF